MRIKNLIPLFVAIIAILLVVWYFSNISIYLIISLILATILRPLTNYINNTQIFKVRIHRLLAVLISFSALLGTVALFIVLFAPLISEQIRIFTNLNFERTLNIVLEPLRQLENNLIELGLANQEPGFITDTISREILNIDFSSLTIGLLEFTGNFFIGIIAIVFITFFLLYEKGLFRSRLIRIIPNQYFEVSISGLYKVEKLLSNYLIGLTLQILAIFILAYTGLSILQIKYAASIALFAAVTNIIPYLGPIIGTMFGIIVGISTNPSMIENGTWLWYIVELLFVFATVQLTDNLVLQPLIFSKSVKAHPLEIFIIIFAGATIAGIPGMIAAIPVYTVFRVFAMEMYRGYQSYHIFTIDNKNG